MAKTAAILAVAASVLALAPTDASAWSCRARSPSAWGWGSSASLSNAQHRALFECARRTPRHQTCYIRACR